MLQILSRRDHGIFRPRSGRTVHSPSQFQSQGRPANRPAGGWLSDLTAIRQTVLLCDGCVHRFDPKPVHYFRETRYQATGACDGCVHYYGKVFLFVHESYLGTTHDPG